VDFLESHFKNEYNFLLEDKKHYQTDKEFQKHVVEEIGYYFPPLHHCDLAEALEMAYYLLFLDGKTIPSSVEKIVRKMVITTLFLDPWDLPYFTSFAQSKAGSPQSDDAVDFLHKVAASPYDSSSFFSLLPQRFSLPKFSHP
jgi:hypothetical protein